MMDMLQTALSYVLPLVGTAGAGLLVWMLKNKFHLQITQEQEKVLTTILQKALAFAEEWARKQGTGKNKATSAEKLTQAADFAKKELARAKIKIPDAQVNDLLHAALGMMR